MADGLMRRHCGRCVYKQRARYRPCALQGGYHSDLPSSWHSLERTVASVAPSIRCSAACLPTDKRSRTAMLAACNPTATLAASMSAVLPLQVFTWRTRRKWHPTQSATWLTLQVGPAGPLCPAVR